MNLIHRVVLSATFAAANAMAQTGTSVPDRIPEHPGKQAAPAGETATSVGVATSRERLSNGTPDWRESSLQFRHRFGPRRMLDLGLAETSRFGLDDTQVSAVYSMPIAAGLTGAIDGNASSTHRVLARNALATTVQWEFAPAWLLHLGGKTTRYDAVRVNQATFMLERYVSSFSWAVGWKPSRAFGASADSAEIRGNYYYGDKSSVGLALFAGEEAANIGGRVTVGDVQALVLIGHHWLNNSWAINYAAGRTRQGDFYNRNGIHLGLEHAY